ncbi:hypothetical protein Csa_021946 [Cucumis sativus]|uniref:Uncharacterized protein n=1 Tax=Cucumis sativus TaxID=3659 RepID=A0A0A0LR98_CUCSA|nr:hypothetical protein Csa_021946 [Cucumis sativus]
MGKGAYNEHVGLGISTPEVCLCSQLPMSCAQTLTYACTFAHELPTMWKAYGGHLPV